MIIMIVYSYALGLALKKIQVSDTSQQRRESDLRGRPRRMHTNSYFKYPPVYSPNRSVSLCTYVLR